ncbi:hypothetical protein [Pseudomonas cichorii]|uniref:hypothetical protein n=1 Tax=Pseudomonas cichorii TaxID=36746 RepID=UPI0019104A4F|nr:hypothetical protein [Pseudomonas cichorii]
MSAFSCFIIFALMGFGLACAGIWMLAGVAWALLAASFSMFCIAGFIRRGLSSE